MNFFDVFDTAYKVDILLSVRIGSWVATGSRNVKLWESAVRLAAMGVGLHRLNILVLVSRVRRRRTVLPGRGGFHDGRTRWSVEEQICNK